MFVSLFFKNSPGAHTGAHRSTKFPQEWFNLRKALICRTIVEKWRESGSGPVYPSSVELLLGSGSESGSRRVYPSSVELLLGNGSESGSGPVFFCVNEHQNIRLLQAE